MAPTRDVFEMRADFDPYNHLGSAWGINWGKGKLETVRLRFTGNAAERVQDNVWHESQEPPAIGDGWVELTFRVGDTLEMVPWIRQWGHECEVMEPEHLRKTIGEHARKMAELYNNAIKDTPTDKHMSNKKAIMSRTSRQSAQALIATLGSEPQVVTLALDQLTARGFAIDQVVVVYTADNAVLQAMARVAGEFDGAVYPRVTLRTTPVMDARGAVQDFRRDDDMRALQQTLYREVREAKRHQRTVHLCVSGGRKNRVTGLLI